MKFRSVRHLVPTLVLLGMGLASPAHAEDRAIDEQHRGFPYYRQYCASCHGLFADGKGLLAPLMKPDPPPLTQLGGRFGTPLAKSALIEHIDGREMPRAHGSSDMPVWGERLLEKIPPIRAKEMAKRATLYLIVDYLAAIQASN